MFILLTTTGNFFGGFMLGRPIWYAHPANASSLTVREAATLSVILKKEGYDVRRQSLTR